MKNTLILSVSISIASLCLIEFLLAPMGLFLMFPFLNGVSYLSGLVLLSIPRVILILIFSALIRFFFGTTSLVIVCACYLIIVIIKYSLSEVYVQQDNFYAFGTAITPYFVGFLTLVISGFLLWRTTSK
jgi:hypothetical protein